MDFEIFDLCSPGKSIYGPYRPHFLSKSPHMDRTNHTFLLESPYMDPQSVKFWKESLYMDPSQSIFLVGSPYRCTLGVWTYTLCLNLSLYFGCLNLYFGCLNLYFGCLNLYFGCLNPYPIWGGHTKKNSALVRAVHRSEGFPNGIFGSWARWTRPPPDVQSCWDAAAAVI